MTTNALREFRKNSLGSGGAITKQPELTYNTMLTKDDSGIFLTPTIKPSDSKCLTTVTSTTSDILLNRNNSSTFGCGGDVIGQKLSSATTTININNNKRICRQKIKEFNDVIMCYLCQGYLINATKIDYCIHSFCRSCIVKHLEKMKYCPQCGSADGKEISLSNLKTDEVLKSLIYKLVPNLHQNEFERNLQYNLENNCGKTNDFIELENEEYFSPVERISLSLEYHPLDLKQFDSNVHEIPPVRYLQCPAALTVHHLKRFICSKFNIDSENESVDIQLIYDNNVKESEIEVLPDDLNLMDIGYCFNWRREAPMRFFYRILVHSVCNNKLDTDRIDDLNDVTTCTEANSNKPETNVETNINYVTKTVRFKEDTNIINDIDSKVSNQTKIEKSRKFESSEHSLSLDPKKESVGKNESKKDIKSMSPTSKNDFKSLRSNDVKFTENIPAAVVSTTKPMKKIKSGSNNFDNNLKMVSKCDIVVSIPQQHLHRASNSSDDSFENLSLAQLKTANKKSSVSPRALSPSEMNNISKQYDFETAKVNEKPKQVKENIPKLKVSLSKNMNKDTKKSTKKRKFSIEEPQPSTNEVDLATYAKVIGLTPVKPIPDEKRDLTKHYSPNASPASATSSSGSSSAFAFTIGETNNTYSHKKRKKAKHSKDQKDSKRRKLHAEMSSPEEGLILKVKLTDNHKSHKSDKKLRDIEALFNFVNSTEKEVASPKMIEKKNEKQANEKLINEKQINSKKIDNTNNLCNVSSVNSDDNINSLKIKSPSPKSPKPLLPPQDTSSKVSPTITIPKSVPNSSPNISPSSIKFLNKIASSVPTPKSIAPIVPKTIASASSPKISSTQPQQNVGDKLPPSLFKTTPMTLQTITTTSTKAVIQQVHQQQAKITNPLQQLALQQHVNRMSKLNNVKSTSSNFIVPNPPRGIASSANMKPFPINSIASASHRQAAQLKRSLSLDGTPNALAKQIKFEQDRAIRKPSYATITQAQLRANITKPTFPTSIASLTNKRNAAPSLAMKQSNGKDQQTFYTSQMGPSYTRENIHQKPVPIVIPPTSISVTKMSEAFGGGIITHPSGLTITPQLPTDPSPLQFPYQQTNKPALEIVRISSNIPPIDQQQLQVTNNNTIKQSATPKATRPPPPPIPLVKIRRSQSLLNPHISGGKLTDEKTKPDESKSLDNSSGIEVLDLSGKSSRSPSREKSPPTPTVENTNNNNNIENLEALKKLKQQKHLLSTQNNKNSPSPIINNSNNKISSDNTNNNALQNLQLLSESATSREKLAVENKAQRSAVSALPKLNEIKRGNATVRQQNASVRNIPNPSALAFRSHQPMPMLATITKTSSPQKPTISSAATISKAPSDSKLSNNETSKLVASQKQHLEQLAATLNQRAAAAADSSTKGGGSKSPLTGSTTVTSTTSLENSNKSVSSSPSSTVSSTTTTSYANNVPLAVTSTSAALSATTA